MGSEREKKGSTVYDGVPHPWQLTAESSSPSKRSDIIDVAGRGGGGTGRAARPFLSALAFFCASYASCTPRRRDESQRQDEMQAGRRASAREVEDSREGRGFTRSVKGIAALRDELAPAPHPATRAQCSGAICSLGEP